MRSPGGYRPPAISGYRGALKHFISWAARDGDRLEVSKSAVRHFLNEHLEDCKCLGRVQRGAVTIRSALNHLLTILGETRLESEAKFPAHVDSELCEYCDYASNVCGLAPATLISRRPVDCTFPGPAVSHEGHQGFAAIAKTNQGLLHFTVSRLPTGHCTGGRCLVRSYLRFRSLRNADQVESLQAAVPSAASWRLAVLPQYIGGE